MSPTLLDALVQWWDVQSLMSRSTDADVSYKPLCARKLNMLTASLWSWYRDRHAIDSDCACAVEPMDVVAIPVALDRPSGEFGGTIEEDGQDDGADSEPSEVAQDEAEDMEGIVALQDEVIESTVGETSRSQGRVRFMP